MASHFNTRMRVLNSKSLFERAFGYPQPQWLWDMALEVRLPALFSVYLVYLNSRLYYESLSAHQPNSKWGIVQGRLLELNKLQYRYVNVPRYTVKYEYEVNGVTYTSMRATTGSPYRNWMRRFYKDCITESQYLQAMPVLRLGERCTVFYDKTNPGGHSALTHDPNSWEISILCFLAAFPLLMGYFMKSHWHQVKMTYGPRPKMKVKFPPVDHPQPPPPPPRQPTQRSPVPRD